MSYYPQQFRVGGLPEAVPIEPYRFVSPGATAGKFKKATAATPVVGINSDRAARNLAERMDFVVSGPMKIELGATCLPWAYVKSDANGAAVPAGAGETYSAKLLDVGGSAGEVVLAIVINGKV
jgi:hypothetical protein